MKNKSFIKIAQVKKDKRESCLKNLIWGKYGTKIL